MDRYAKQGRPAVRLALGAGLLLVYFSGWPGQALGLMILIAAVVLIAGAARSYWTARPRR